MTAEAHVPEKRRYQFQWSLLGDIQAGRPNLGHNTRLEVYRLMQFTFRDVIEQHYGSDEADRIFYEAGMLAGKAYYANLLTGIEKFDDFIRRLEESLSKMTIGILRVEKADIETGSFVITVSEDLDCSGLPELDYEICTYDEGFIAGLLESYTGVPFKVKEVDCWCTGDRTCRFTAEIAR
jgi:predicted hydrocarbon binding protein